jgi:hypothetical protein
VQIAVYYFPGYHLDPRNEAIHGPGWTEWQLLKHARPRFHGHQQPRLPLWGYEDEADPLAFACKINAATEYGVDCFIFDWYWYDGRPFLQRALEHGYLGAPNHDQLRFALMWANHDWVDIFPARYGVEPTLLFRGAISRSAFDQLAEYVVERHFKNPAYWTIAGCPYFSIYELYRLIEGLGSLEATQDALHSFRGRVKAAGFPDLHLNAVIGGLPLLPGEQALADPAEVVAKLGIQSVTSYVCIHHVDLKDFPASDYSYAMAEMARYWVQAAAQFDVPYFPNVTVGWDSTPRTDQAIEFKRGKPPMAYPYLPVLIGNTPQAFERAMIRAARFLAAQPGRPQVITVNAWNEWTEGSYLEPDTVTGMGYLEAIHAARGAALPE